MVVRARQSYVWRLHTDTDGKVWSGDDCALGEPLADSLEAFTEELDRHCERICDRFEEIRLLGSEPNAPLAVTLWRWLVQRHSPARVYLAHPRSAAGDEPAAVLHHLWQPEENTRFIRLTPAVVCAYALAAERQTVLAQLSQPYVPARVQAILQRHPAYPAASFVQQPDQFSLVTVLAQLLDPRWFVHPLRPGRLSGLYNYFGLTPANIRAMLGLGSPGRHYERACAVVRVWYNWQAAERVLPPKRSQRDVPEAYLWRIYHQHRRSPKAILIASKKWLTLVYHFWLNQLTANHPEVRFDPTRSFKYLPEAKQFQKYLLACRDWLDFELFSRR
jgi:hypothetical protein